MSSNNFRKLALHTLNMVTGFSTARIKLAGKVGIAVTMFGMGVLIYVLGRYLIEGGSVPGFPLLTSIIAIFSSAQLFALSIIDKYLARMHYRMMERPPYAVRERAAHRKE